MFGETKATQVLACYLMITLLGNKFVLTSSSCPAGYLPPDCSQKCPIGRFGHGCASTCPSSCLGNRCRKDTGLCLRCRPGFHGRACLTKCLDGFHGIDCLEKCPVKCNDTTCDPHTGYCRGCAAGWRGAKCDIVIPAKEKQLGSSKGSNSENKLSGRPGSEDEKFGTLYILMLALAFLVPGVLIPLAVYFLKKKMKTMQRLRADSGFSRNSHPRKPRLAHFRNKRFKGKHTSGSSRTTKHPGIVKDVSNKPQYKHDSAQAPHHTNNGLDNFTNPVSSTSASKVTKKHGASKTSDSSPPEIKEFSYREGKKLLQEHAQVTLERMKNFSTDLYFKEYPGINVNAPVPGEDDGFEEIDLGTPVTDSGSVTLSIVSDHDGSSFHSKSKGQGRSDQSHDKKYKRIPSLTRLKRTTAALQYLAARVLARRQKEKEGTQRRETCCDFDYPGINSLCEQTDAVYMPTTSTLPSEQTEASQDSPVRRTLAGVATNVRSLFSKSPYRTMDGSNKGCEHNLPRCCQSNNSEMSSSFSCTGLSTRGRNGKEFFTHHQGDNIFFNIPTSLENTDIQFGNNETSLRETSLTNQIFTLNLDKYDGDKSSNSVDMYVSEESLNRTISDELLYSDCERVQNEYTNCPFGKAQLKNSSAHTLLHRNGRDRDNYISGLNSVNSDQTLKHIKQKSSLIHGYSAAPKMQSAYFHNDSYSRRLCQLYDIKDSQYRTYVSSDHYARYMQHRTTLELFCGNLNYAHSNIKSFRVSSDVERGNCRKGDNTQMNNKHQYTSSPAPVLAQNNSRQCYNETNAGIYHQKANMKTDTKRFKLKDDDQHKSSGKTYDYANICQATPALENKVCQNVYYEENESKLTKSHAKTSSDSDNIRNSSFGNQERNVTRTEDLINMCECSDNTFGYNRFLRSANISNPKVMACSDYSKSKDGTMTPKLLDCKIPDSTSSSALNKAIVKIDTSKVRKCISLSGFRKKTNEKDLRISLARKTSFGGQTTGDVKLVSESFKKSHETVSNSFEHNNTSLSSCDHQSMKQSDYVLQQTIRSKKKPRCDISNTTESDVNKEDPEGEKVEHINGQDFCYEYLNDFAKHNGPSKETMENDISKAGSVVKPEQHKNGKLDQAKNAIENAEHINEITATVLSEISIKKKGTIIVKSEKEMNRKLDRKSLDNDCSNRKSQNFMDVCYQNQKHFRDDISKSGLSADTTRPDQQTGQKGQSPDRSEIILTGAEVSITSIDREGSNINTKTKIDLVQKEYQTSETTDNISIDHLYNRQAKDDQSGHENEENKLGEEERTNSINHCNLQLKDELESSVKSNSGIGRSYNRVDNILSENQYDGQKEELTKEGGHKTKRINTGMSMMQNSTERSKLNQYQVGDQVIACLHPDKRCNERIKAILDDGEKQNDGLHQKKAVNDVSTSEPKEFSSRTKQRDTHYENNLSVPSDHHRNEQSSHYKGNKHKIKDSSTSISPFVYSDTDPGNSEAKNFGNSQIKVTTKITQQNVKPVPAPRRKLRQNTLETEEQKIPSVGLTNQAGYNTEAKREVGIETVISEQRHTVDCATGYPATIGDTHAQAGVSSRSSFRCDDVAIGCRETPVGSAAEGYISYQKETLTDHNICRGHQLTRRADISTATSSENGFLGNEVNTKRSHGPNRERELQDRLSPDFSKTLGPEFQCTKESYSSSKSALVEGSMLKSVEIAEYPEFLESTIDNDPQNVFGEANAGGIKPLFSAPVYSLGMASYSFRLMKDESISKNAQSNHLPLSDHTLQSNDHYQKVAQSITATESDTTCPELTSNVTPCDVTTANDEDISCVVTQGDTEHVQKYNFNISNTEIKNNVGIMLPSLIANKERRCKNIQSFRQGKVNILEKETKATRAGLPFFHAIKSENPSKISPGVEEATSLLQVTSDSVEVNNTKAGFEAERYFVSLNQNEAKCKHDLSIITTEIGGQRNLNNLEKETKVSSGASSFFHTVQSETTSKILSENEDDMSSTEIVKDNIEAGEMVPKFGKSMSSVKVVVEASKIVPKVDTAMSSLQVVKDSVEASKIMPKVDGAMSSVQVAGDSVEANDTQAGSVLISDTIFASQAEVQSTNNACIHKTENIGLSEWISSHRVLNDTRKNEALYTSETKSDIVSELNETVMANINEDSIFVDSYNNVDVDIFSPPIEDDLDQPSESTSCYYTTCEGCKTNEKRVIFRGPQDISSTSLRDTRGWMMKRNEGEAERSSSTKLTSDCFEESTKYLIKKNEDRIDKDKVQTVPTGLQLLIEENSQGVPIVVQKKPTSVPRRHGLNFERDHQREKEKNGKSNIQISPALVLALGKNKQKQNGSFTQQQSPKLKFEYSSRTLIDDVNFNKKYKRQKRREIEIGQNHVHDFVGAEKHCHQYAQQYLQYGKGNLLSQMHAPQCDTEGILNAVTESCEKKEISSHNTKETKSKTSTNNSKLKKRGRSMPVRKLRSDSTTNVGKWQAATPSMPDGEKIHSLSCGAAFDVHITKHDTTRSSSSNSSSDEYFDIDNNTFSK